MKQSVISLLRYLIYCSFFIISSCSDSNPAIGQPVMLRQTPLIKKVVVSSHDISVMHFINDDALYTEGWDTIAQPKFWKSVMRLSPDSAIINVADNRSPLGIIDFNKWMKQDEKQKSICRNEFCSQFKLDSATRLFITNGKKDFFEHRKSLQAINTAITTFSENGVDPWYGETILLIESPGKNLQKSWAGARGPFQLMREVAIRYGLKVNHKVDQRTDLLKSATVASKLIGNNCIPKVKAILDSLGVKYNETDIWFRLLVLHAYHAGPGNIGCALYSIAPKTGGPELIKRIWRTECNGFKNESQNYSQLALAAHLSFNEILGNPDDTVFLVQGDRKYNIYKKQQHKNQLTYQQLTDCMNSYGEDVVDGTIEPEYYIMKINKLKKEMAAYDNSGNENNYLTISNQLLRKRKVDDAIKLLRFTIEQYPHSASAADSLSRAYKLSGKNSLAMKYELISEKLAKTNAP